MRDVFELTAEIWRWQGPEGVASWHFVTVPAELAAEIRFAALGRANRFGAVRVAARIGGTRWQTSLFPDKKSGGFVLPVKADVRRREGLEVGSSAEIALEV